MGSFSVCCGVTRLAIDSGDRCVLIPLTPPVYREDNFLSGTNPVDNRGASAIYYPAGYPILGRYDDYGRIDPDDSQSLFWEQMESKFGLPASGFVDYADPYHKTKYSNLQIEPTGRDRTIDLKHGMWVHEDAWKSIISTRHAAEAEESVKKTIASEQTKFLTMHTQEFWGFCHRVLGYRLHLSDVLDVGGWSIMDAYRDLESDPRTTEELSDVIAFKNYCSWHNILISPYIQVLQHGEPKEEIKHARLVMSIAQSRYDRYVADYGDEDED